MSNLDRQASFASGELAPEFYGRTDQPSYRAGLRLAKNFIPTPRGALVSRPGHPFVCEVKDSSADTVLVSFVFSDAQTYVLEFGNQYMRFVSNGAQVLVPNAADWSAIPGYAVTGITRKFGGIVYVLFSTAGLAVGDHPDTHPANWFPLGTAGDPLEFVTPWVTADIGRLKFTQSGDVIAVTHQNYAPQEISRFSEWYWTVAAIDFVPRAYFGSGFRIDGHKVACTDPGFVFATPVYDPAHDYLAGDYAVADATALAENIGLVFVALKPCTGITPGIAANANFWVPAFDATHFPAEWGYVQTIVYADSNGVTHETLPSTVSGASGDAGTDLVAMLCETDRPVGLTWTLPAAQSFSYRIIGFNIYRGRKRVFGLVGTAKPTATTFSDPGITPDYAVQPPAGTNPFTVGTGTTGAGAAASDSYPAASTYHEQRWLPAGSPAKPGTFWGSMIASLKRFDVKTPVIASDPYEFALACVQLEDIRWLLSINGLLIGTGAGVWSARGVNGGVLSPVSVDVRRRSKGGVSYLRPLEVRGNALYVTAKANRVRDIRINWAAYGDASFEQSDLSHYARHLFEGHTIVDWCYAEEPYSIIWAVRDDGALLSLAYDPASQTLGWAQHYTDEKNDAVYEAVCSVPEGTEDAVYVVVKRTINGQTKRYIERLATRHVTDVRTYCGSDCGKSYDGHSTDGSTVQIINYTSGLPGGSEADITSTAASFAAGDPGDVIVLDPDGTDFDIDEQPDWDTATIYGYGATVAYKDQVWFSLQANVGNAPSKSPDWWAVANGPFRATILSYTNSGQVHVMLDGAVGPGSATTTKWGIARRVLTGLDHLEGKTVAVLADGNVQAQQVVGAGQITLENHGLMVQVGLPFNCDAELLDIPLDQMKTNVKGIVRVNFEIVVSRGLYAGEDFDNLKPVGNWRKVADSFGLPQLKTDSVPVTIGSSWNIGGRAVVRQVDPLPLTIVAAVREFELGGRDR